jgi:hypothetical protein
MYGGRRITIYTHVCIQLITAYLVYIAACSLRPEPKTAPKRVGRSPHTQTVDSHTRLDRAQPTKASDNIVGQRDIG